MQRTLDATLPPTVSIIMPVHNVEAYVAESIASIRAQAWQTWELIVVNDGSTDNTEGVVQALASEDSRIRLLNQRNSGAASARNRGLDMIRGDFLAFLDGDDLWHKDFLAQAIAMMECTRVDLFFCGLERLQTDGSRRAVAMKVEPGISSPADLIESFLAGPTLLAMGNVVLRRTPELCALRFIEGCRHAEDTEYLVRALSRVPSAYFLEDPLFLYRLRPGSVTQQAWDWRVRMDAIHAMERTLAHLLEEAQDGPRPSLDKVCWNLQFTKFRFLYRMVKTGAWSHVRTLLAQDNWRSSLHSVVERGHRKHRCEARIMLNQNALLWGLVSFYARCKSRPLLPFRATR